MTGLDRDRCRIEGMQMGVGCITRKGRENIDGNMKNNRDGGSRSGGREYGAAKERLRAAVTAVAAVTVAGALKATHQRPRQKTALRGKAARDRGRGTSRGMVSGMGSCGGRDGLPVLIFY